MLWSGFVMRCDMSFHQGPRNVETYSFLTDACTTGEICDVCRHNKLVKEIHSTEWLYKSAKTPSPPPKKETSFISKFKAWLSA